MIKLFKVQSEAPTNPFLFVSFVMFLLAFSAALGSYIGKLTNQWNEKEQIAQRIDAESRTFGVAKNGLRVSIVDWNPNKKRFYNCECVFK